MCTRATTRRRAARCRRCSRACRRRCCRSPAPRRPTSTPSAPTRVTARGPYVAPLRRQQLGAPATRRQRRPVVDQRHADRRLVLHGRRRRPDPPVRSRQPRRSRATRRPAPRLLFGIWGTGANDLWAVGGDLDDEPGGVVWHFDGQTWTAQDSQRRACPHGMPTLNKVWGRSADDVYAVGGRGFGIILHFDGASWSKVGLRHRAGPLFTVHGNDSIVVATGGFFDRLRCSSSTAAPSSTARRRAPQLNGVFVPPDGAAVAVGNERSVAFRDRRTGRSASPGSTPLATSMPPGSIPEGGIWAVGGDLVDPRPTASSPTAARRRPVDDHHAVPDRPARPARAAVSYSDHIAPLLTDAHAPTALATAAASSPRAST